MCEFGYSKRLKRSRSSAAAPIHQFRLVSETAPSNVARIFGAYLRHQAASHEGPTATSGDQQTSGHLAAIGKTGFDPLGTLLEGGELRALVILGREMPAHGAVKRRPGGQHLAHRKAPREATAAVEKHPLLGLDTDRGVIVHAGSAERLQHLGLQHDATPAAVEVTRRALVNVDIPPDRAQQQPSEETAERSANHHRLFRCARLVLHRSPPFYSTASVLALAARRPQGQLSSEG